MRLDFRVHTDAAEKQPDVRLALIERLHECLVVPVEDEKLPVEILERTISSPIRGLASSIFLFSAAPTKLKSRSIESLGKSR